MKAIFYDRYGSADVLYTADAIAPPQRPGFARINVRACALNPKDVLIRKGKMRWLSPGGFPRCPGYDVSGILLDDAGDLLSGTPVYAMIQDNQGRGCAQIVSLPHDQLARTPERLSFEQAACVPLAALTALQALRARLALKAGDSSSRSPGALRR